MTTIVRRLVIVAVALGFAITAAAPASAQYFGQNKVQYDDFDFEVLETDHFDIYYYPVEAEAARMTARMAERWYARLSTLLGHQLSSRQAVVLYASHPEFEQTNVIEGLISEATGGVTEGGRRRVVMPLAASLGETDHVLGHELVHAFQYDILGQNIGRAPLWFIEGMAEYLSVGPRHPQTAMWLRDAAFEAALPTLNDLYNPSYFPYRFGHALWAYIGGRFGDAAVASALHRMASVQGGMDPITAIELTTEMKADELAEAWHASIYAIYGITPRDREQVAEINLELPRALLAERSGSGSMNVGPSLSPNGERIAFLSERSRLSIELYVADTKTGTQVRRLTSTAVDPHFESLQFLGSSGTWAPDNRRLAVASVQRGRGAIAIFDVDNGNILDNIRLDQRGEIFQPSWSPDGRSIAFAAQVGGFTDLYIYDLERRQTRRITNDPFADLQPAFSPDGQRLLFVTDRFSSSLDALQFGQMGLATIDVSTGQVAPVVTGLEGAASSPQWSSDGSAITFVADNGGRPDVYRLRLGTGQAVPLTELPTGVSGITPLSPALSVARTTDTTAYTVFRNGAYEIRLLDPDATAEVARTDLARLPPEDRQASDVAAQLESQEPLPAPQSVDTRAYKANMALAGIGQSLGASTGGAFGTYVSGGISMLFSDVLGNHLVPVTFGVEGRVKDIAAQTAYINRTRRWNWGVIASHVPVRSGFIDAGIVFDNGYPLYVETTDILRETTTEVGGLLAYPFSRALRVEFNASVRRIGFGRERESFVYDGFTGQFLERQTEDLGGLPALRLGSTSVALVRDSTAFGAVSPVLGQRFRFEVAPSFGDLQITTATLDFRHYVMPVRPLTLAVRGLHLARYGSGGEDSRLYPLFLGYPSMVRGYDAGSFQVSECTITASGACPEFDRLLGSRLAAFNGEARVPLFGLFTGHLDYGPIPAELFGFFDAGVAWTRSETPSFSGGSRSLVKSAGLGARVNLFGYAIGEFNAVRALDRPGKGWQFVFNLRPGF